MSSPANLPHRYAPRPGAANLAAQRAEAPASASRPQTPPRRQNNNVRRQVPRGASYAGDRAGALRLAADLVAYPAAVARGPARAARNGAHLPSPHHLGLWGSEHPAARGMGGQANPRPRPGSPPPSPRQAVAPPFECPVCMDHISRAEVRARPAPACSRPWLLAVQSAAWDLTGGGYTSVVCYADHQGLPGLPRGTQVSLSTVYSTSADLDRSAGLSLTAGCPPPPQPHRWCSRCFGEALAQVFKDQGQYGPHKPDGRVGLRCPAATGIHKCQNLIEPGG